LRSQHIPMKANWLSFAVIGFVLPAVRHNLLKFAIVYSV
jgi:hypothetical protein